MWGNSHFHAFCGSLNWCVLFRGQFVSTNKIQISLSKIFFEIYHIYMYIHTHKCKEINSRLLTEVLFI